MRTTAGLALLGLLTVAGCARPTAPGGPSGEGTDPMATADLVAEDYTGRFRTATTVLESRTHGPQLCAFVATSYPPQCGGPDIVGWDWSTVTAESANGTTWGSYLLTGTWDGTAFTLTEPAVTDDGSLAAKATVADFSAPCPEPAGGWRPVDPQRAGRPDLDAALEAAQATTGYAGSWVDQRGGRDNDPNGLVLVVRTAGRPGELEAAIRQVWGGALCVTQARYSYAELLAAQQELSQEPGVTGSGPNDVANQLDLGVFVATEERQRDLDARFGAGLVRQTGLLQPLD